MQLANLKSGQLDFIRRMAPSDVPGLKSDSRFKISKITEPATRASRSASEKRPRAEESAEEGSARARNSSWRSIASIVQVAMDGEAAIGNQ